MGLKPAGPLHFPDKCGLLITGFGLICHSNHLFSPSLSPLLLSTKSCSACLSTYIKCQYFRDESQRNTNHSCMLLLNFRSKLCLCHTTVHTCVNKTLTAYRFIKALLKLMALTSDSCLFLPPGPEAKLTASLLINSFTRGSNDTQLHCQGLALVF